MTSINTLALRYAADLAAAVETDEALLHRLVDEFGIAPEIAGRCLLGMARADLCGRSWTPMARGVRVLTLPIWHDGTCADIAAVVLRGTRGCGEALRVYRTTGQAAGVVFDAGAAVRPVQTFRGQAVPASITNGALRLHSTPLAWLRANCEGLLVFDYDRIEALWQCGELVVDNVEHRDQVATARARWIARTVPAVTIITVWERDVGRA